MDAGPCRDLTLAEALKLDLERAAGSCYAPTSLPFWRIFDTALLLCSNAAMGRCLLRTSGSACCRARSSSLACRAACSCWTWASSPCSFACRSLRHRITALNCKACYVSKWQSGPVLLVSLPLTWTYQLVDGSTQDITL